MISYSSRLLRFPPTCKMSQGLRSLNQCQSRENIPILISSSIPSSAALAASVPRKKAKLWTCVGKRLCYYMLWQLVPLLYLYDNDENQLQIRRHRWWYTFMTKKRHKLPAYMYVAYLRLHLHPLQESLKACCIVGSKSTLISNYSWIFLEVVVLHLLEAVGSFLSWFPNYKICGNTGVGG